MVVATWRALVMWVVYHRYLLVALRKGVTPMGKRRGREEVLLGRHIGAVCAARGQ